MSDPSTPDHVACECNLVAETAALSYRIHGHSADVTAAPWATVQPGMCDGRVVFVPDLSRIDFVADYDGDLRRAAQTLATEAEAGWDVWAVVPLARLADAHDVFRDRVQYVQGWWLRASGEIAFTEPEVP